MLKGISPLISPELLETLARMGHGDEIVLADAHFPGETMGRRVVRADGLRIPDLLDYVVPRQHEIGRDVEGVANGLRVTQQPDEPFREIFGMRQSPERSSIAVDDNRLALAGSAQAGGWTWELHPARREEGLTVAADPAAPAWAATIDRHGRISPWLRCDGQ